MAIEKKRPRGLKGSAAQKAAKKTKTETPDSSVPENAQTVVLGKVVEEGDEVGEAAALYESAIEKMGNSPSEARALLRGTIHESDRILRNWDATKTMPLEFYFTYGSALFELGRLTEDEEFDPYLEAAEERLEDGLSHYETLENKEESAGMMNRIKVSLAKVWLSKAASEVDQGSDVIPDLAKRALDTLEEVVPLAALTNATKVELASIVQNHGDLYTEWDSRTKFTNWAEKLLEEVLEDSPEHSKALSEIGLCKLSLANYWLDQVNDDEDEDEEEEKTKRTEEEEKAFDAFGESKKYLEKAHANLKMMDQLEPHHSTDLAEACLNQANLMLEENERTDLYKQAISYIQEAKEVAAKSDQDYELPDALESFLEEWEE
ncbi:negative regulator of Ofd1/Enhancer of translation termination 1 [Phycomyces nitens]|nr:negative regulator of Ofd1/Enhancer of translation termination 1 [Phycomyces nitens]